MAKYPKDLEKRLSNAYDAGYFDGYHEGVDDTHIIWTDELENVKGIGIKRREAILIHMTRAMKKRQEARKVSKNGLSEEVASSGATIE